MPQGQSSKVMALNGTVGLGVHRRAEDEGSLRLSGQGRSWAVGLGRQRSG